MLRVVAKQRHLDTHYCCNCGSNDIPKQIGRFEDGTLILLCSGCRVGIKEFTSWTAK